MPRRSQIDEKRRELLPIVARAFADLGYRRTTTAELAQRCGVQENILYRLWPDKKAMFIAAIAYVYDLSVQIWGRVLAERTGNATGPGRTGAQTRADRTGVQTAAERAGDETTAEGAGEQTAAERLLAYESGHHGEFGHYRIVFAGLSETDDPDIQKALADMYRRYLRFVQTHIAAHQAKRGAASPPDAALLAWAVVGLGTVASISRELGLLGNPQRRRLMAEIGGLLLDGSAA